MPESRSLLLVGLAVAAAMLSTAPARAQVSVEVSPLRVELQTAPGGSHTQVVTLRNHGNAPIRVFARVDDWTLSRDGTPQFTSAGVANPFSAAAWVRLTPSEQLLEPGKEAAVRFTTTVPAGTTDAGYRTAIMFEFAPASADPTKPGREVMFRGRIATMVYVTVGRPAVAVDLTDLKAATNDAGEVMRIVASLKNTGRGYTRTKGSMLIVDASGKTVREVKMPDAPVLPESERDLAIPLGGEGEPALPAGEYRVEVKLEVGMPALLVGETTVKLGK